MDDSILESKFEQAAVDFIVNEATQETRDRLETIYMRLRASQKFQILHKAHNTMDYHYVKALNGKIPTTLLARTYTAIIFFFDDLQSRFTVLVSEFACLLCFSHGRSMELDPRDFGDSVLCGPGVFPEKAFR